MSSTKRKTDKPQSRLNTSMSNTMHNTINYATRASRRPRRLTSISLFSLLAFGCFSAVQAQTNADCAGIDCGGRIQAFAAPSFLGAGDSTGAGTAQKLPVGANTEASPRDAEGENWGFNISVDGERLVGDTTVEDWQRRTDVDLASADIQVKFDGLGVKPILNVSTKDVRQSYRAGEKIDFVSTTNYPAWISKAEIRIHDAKLTPASKPSQVIHIEGSRDLANWRMPTDGPTEYTYVLRVYDAKGRFDETTPLILRRTSKRYEKHETAPQEPAISAGEGEDRTAVRNIPVYGGAITVFGRDVPTGFHVDALGERVPVDANGAFVVQRILPPGEHSVDVSVKGRRHGQLKFVREVNIPENEWFYVGLADLTVGKRSGSKSLVAAAPGEFKKVYDKGRLAFYLKGKIKGRYLLTAAADTGEGKVRNLFKNFDDKSPAELIRRIDPNKFYPVYGDDSTAIEDAPTDGKFYVKLERGKSHVMWGRFKTSIKGTEFARNERKLYGGHGVYRSEATTAHGASRVEAEAYASKPNTLPQRDNLRGTGGSVYFLSRQDINRNSETLTIEVRDNISGFVLKRHALRYGEDYDINYVQGVVILKKPLASTAGSDTFITDGGLDGHSQVLVAQYEYTPGLDNVKGYSVGGRFQTWITDNVRVGVSGMNEETGTADQIVLGGDLHVRLGANSYAEVETSRSEGPGFGNTNSLNGGLTITANNTAGAKNREAWAHRAKVHADLDEMGTGMKGHIGAYYEWRGKGYSSIAHNTPNTQHTYGVEAKVEVRDDLRYLMKYRDYHDSTGQVKRVGDGQIEYDWDKLHTISFGLKHTDVQSGQFSTSDGARTDVGVKVSYKPDENHEAYVFGQVTVNNTGNLDRNDRVGIGGKRLITEKVGIKGEVSYGTLGWGGLAGITYDPTADDHYYFGYKLDPDRQVNSSTSLNGYDQGAVVLGAKHKVSDQLAAYAENNYDMFGHRQSLTSTYGVVYTPTALWVVNSGIEYGEVKDRNSDNLDRIALSASVAYKDPEMISWRLKGEARFEESQDSAKDRDTFLLSAGTKIKHDENWRFLASFDSAISRSNQADFLDGDYMKGSVGYAYRGTDSDDVSALFKYIFLYDLPGPDQVNSQGLALGPAQRSHIISADVSYDVSKYVTIGAKYGARFGETSQDRSRKNFVKSSAHLGIIRADLHIVKKWDAMLEARVLHTPEIDTTKTALLAGVYRHIGNNLKFGVGYNFGKFSDDVADLTHDEHGVFVNLVGKF